MSHTIALHGVVPESRMLALDEINDQWVTLVESVQLSWQMAVAYWKQNSNQFIKKKQAFPVFP